MESQILARLGSHALTAPCSLRENQNDGVQGCRSLRTPGALFLLSPWLWCPFNLSVLFGIRDFLLTFPSSPCTPGYFHLPQVLPQVSLSQKTAWTSLFNTLRASNLSAPPLQYPHYLLPYFIYLYCTYALVCCMLYLFTIFTVYQSFLIIM